ncbi:hypothetical protein Afil01_17590 [Actinorhabdospora filicis]|uniref:Uncharacterized protein n=2 Tax=Actinorhabdospora filicis TaxID=1785913 RepID=A0A9W6SJH9_9ACTN|nr:hypothetical protein Afil01_17590 [Actinorhabdospora filicis]
MVLGGVVVVAAFGFYACSGGEDAPPATPAAAEATVGATSAPPPAEDDGVKHPYVGDSQAAKPSASGPVPGAVCPDAALAVVAKPSGAVIPKGGYLTIEVTVTNTSAVACAREVGSKAQEVQVKAGEERLWSSDDCAGAGDPGKRTLQPGEVVTSRVTWNGKTSTPGCRSGSRTVPAGKYEVTARCGTLWGKPAAFTID